MANYTHTQSSASTTWVVEHNNGDTAIVSDAMVDDGPNAPAMEKILPASVVSTNDNTMTITFSTARTGVVRVVGGI
jgi:hypothetical protein